MSPYLIGALVHLPLAIILYVTMGRAHDKLIREGADPRRLRAVNFMRHFQLVTIPLVGSIAGPAVVANWKG
jgi:hypothetical protein